MYKFHLDGLVVEDDDEGLGDLDGGLDVDADDELGVDLEGDDLDVDDDDDGPDLEYVYPFFSPFMLSVFLYSSLL